VGELEQDGAGALTTEDGSATAAIAAIWAEILGLERVEEDANFFELGGDSLAAVRMLVAIEERLLAQVSFTDFLELPTVAALARLTASSGVGAAVEAAAAGQPTPPPGAEGPLPLSYGQERLWFLEQLGGSTAAYNMPIGARLRGELDREALRAALGDLIERHEALRTTIAAEDGRPVARVSDSGELDLQEIDLRGERDAEGEASRLLAELASRPFDLERGPLLRVALVRVGDHEHVLELVFHHIVCDGWSQAVAMRELGVLYEAARSHETAVLESPRVQYSQFARRQRAELDERGLEHLLAPWLERLAGAPETIDLPTDRRRPGVPTYAGATYRIRLSAGTAAAVRAFAKSARATPYATFLSALYALLYRLSGQRDIVIGATTAAREAPGLEDGVGLFASTVALRGELSDELSFRELVGSVSATVLWAVAHEQAPLQEIVARLPLQRDLTRHPLFQVFCAQVPLADLPIAGAQPYDALPTTARFDLTLFIEEKLGGELELAWEYSSELFDAATIERMARWYIRLLQGGLADGERKIEDLPLLDREERERALAAGRSAANPYPVACLHELFERRAAAAPDALAVSFESDTLTYAELDRRANQLAHRLIALGAGPETLVALLLAPSLELVVGILGVLKAGAAYLPLDPEHPRERLDFVLSDAGSELLVTDSKLLDRLGSRPKASVCLDRDAAELQQQSVERPHTEVSPESLAYVIYTSGSTGRPKGVQVEHRHVARLLSATDEWFGFGEGDVWIMLHSYAFDFSVWELWGALAYGGELVVSPVWTTRSPQALAELLARRGVTVLNATPSLFAAVQEELLGRAGELRLRYVIFGGEALRPPVLRPWFEHHGDGGPTLVNMYGITETTVHVTYRPLSARDCMSDTSPIGDPIPDLSLYLLDRSGGPVPDGVAAELYVGGAGVARGYLNRPELTAQRFVENPFGPGRLYRTGDVAARLADGGLDFRGRIDEQVKIRGFRIELGEIEGALREHPLVEDCAVVAVEAAADQRLAAYVVIKDDTAKGLREELLDHLQQKLPSYMVPAALTLLEQIPLTRNGKIERRALPAPTWEREADSDLLEPETAMEKLVAAIWMDVLGLERVGAQDNFFSLGGHSLLAARVVSQVRRRSHAEISVRALFEQPTLREFAAAVDSASSAKASASSTAAPAVGAAADSDQGEPVGRQGAPPLASGAEDGLAGADLTASPTGLHPLSFPQQQLLFFDQLAPGSVTYNAALAWRVVGELDEEALRSALSEVFARQQALRTVLVWGEQGEPGQQVLEQWEVSLPLVDLSQLDAAEQQSELTRRLSEHARQPFDLSRELMLRVTLFRLAPQEHVILFAPHHVAFDAWAVEVLYRELGELYDAALEGREAQLPQLQRSYRDFASWQRDRLSGELLADELDFWRGHLAGAPTLTQLPTDRPRLGEQAFAGATHRFLLDGELAEQVRELCAQAGVTPYMLLLAAFATLLYRSSGQDDVLIGGPMANRQLAGIENLIGFFANTVVVRVSLAGNPSFREMLTRARDSVLASYEHQEVPLELVVEAVRPEREPGVHPLFQVNFRVRVGDPPALRLAGTSAEPVPVDLQLARFELSLELHLHGDRIEGELNYDVALFDRATVERLAEDFEAVLRSLTLSPDDRLLSVQLDSEPTPDDTEAGALPPPSAIRGFRAPGRLNER
jgi:amino acid adenylation domain-containing protein